MLDAIIWKFCFKCFQPTWQTLSLQINMIGLNLVCHKNYWRWTHPHQKSTQLLIYVLVQFLQQHLWHRITCNQYVHNLQYTWKIAEQMTLHHHQMSNNHHQASHVQKTVWHAETYTKMYRMYQTNLIHTQVYQNLLLRAHLTHLIHLTSFIINKRNKCPSKRINSNLVQHFSKIKSKLLKFATNYNVTKFKIDQYPL